ncbi:MAG: T9SS type A sorting domain-containing protein [Chitinophagaceae bacterium]|nr:T9SS type A sorting domain-containing protein [Chitinophagaceae bacterium]
MKKLLLFILLFPLWIQAQIPGNSLQLKANGNFFTVADASSVSLNDTMSMEMMLYFRCNNGQSTHLMTKGWCGNGDWSYYWSVYDNKLRFSRWHQTFAGGCAGTQAIFETTDSIPFNTWTHVAVTIRDLDVKMYINGIDAGATLISGQNGDGFNPCTQPIRIGNYLNASSQNVGTPLCNMDELRIWHKELTASDILSNMNQELTGNEPGLVAYYQMNESGSGAGISVVNSAAGSSLPNGTTVGSVANLQFNDNSTIIDALPTCDPILWLKADAGVTVNVNNEVTQWADQSGNNYHAVADGTTLPVLQNNTINNKPVINFTDDRLATPLINLTPTNQTEAFVVYKGIGSNGFSPFEFSDDGNVVSTGFYLADQDNSCPGCQNDVTAGLKGDVGYNQNSLNQTQGCPKIINATYNKSLSTEEVKIWLNGVLQPKTPGTTNANNTNNFGNHKFYLGKRSANCTFCPGVMGQFYYAELIVFQRILSSKEKNLMKNYLHKKYFTGASGAYTSASSGTSYSTNVYDDLIWKHTFNSTSPTSIIASVKDYCAELGSRTDTVYVEPSAVNIGSTYAMRRHFTIQTALQPAGTKRVRLYYTQADFADLQTVVPGLTSHSQLCVTKYDGPNEDGVFSNTGGTLTFIPASQITTGTAFGARYLEFDVTGFSEFWIHTGNIPLPVYLTSFSAQKCDAAACLNWKTSQEQNVHSYSIERSSDARSFYPIGQTLSLGDSESGHDYAYTDLQPLSGMNYYRIIAKDIDGHQQFSAVKSVLFSSSPVPVMVYPTYSATGQYNIETLATIQHIELYSINGQWLKTLKANKNIDLQECSAGMYLLKVYTDEGISNHKVLR